VRKISHASARMLADLIAQEETPLRYGSPVWVRLCGGGFVLISQFIAGGRLLVAEWFTIQCGPR